MAKNDSMKTFIHYEQTGAVWKLSDIFLNYIPFEREPILFCCIGTDRSTGDALGPLTGSFLSNYFSFPFEVMGTLEQPLHALNLPTKVKEINALPTKPFIVAIDACLSHEKHIGQIIVQEGPILPGIAVNKKLPPIGDLSIKGIVNMAGFMEMTVLQNTRLNVTYSMSNKIARALHLSYQRYLLKRKKDGNNNADYYDSRKQISYSNFR